MFGFHDPIRRSASNPVSAMSAGHQLEHVHWLPHPCMRWRREARRGAAPEARLPVETSRRKMSLARPLSRPKPPEAVAEGVPGMGTGLDVKVLRGARW